MAEPMDTVKKLQASFGKGGKELSRYDLEVARQTLAEHAARQPSNTRLPWYIQRIDNRLHFLDTGEARPEPPTPPQSKQEKRAGQIAAAVLVLVVGGCSYAVFGRGGGGGGDEGGAIAYCHQFVEDRLRAPSTADFPSSPEHRVTELGDQRWRVAAYVDAENGFGAQIRTEWTCEISYEESSETWTLESLTGL